MRSPRGAGDAAFQASHEPAWHASTPTVGGGAIIWMIHGRTAQAGAAPEAIEGSKIPMAMVIVVTTVDSRERAQHIVRAVVGARLAACGQIVGPIASTYWWRDTLEEAEEWLCLFKTVPEAYDELEPAIRALHPYELPEIVALPVAQASAGYLDWCTRTVAARHAP